MNEVRSKRNLKSIVVEPFKQIKIGAYVIVVSLIFLVIAGASISYAFYEQYQQVMEIFNVIDASTQWELVTNDIFFKNALILAGVFIAYVVLLFVIVFKATHRIYGPLVGVERFVGQLTTGDYQRRIVIRRGDELQRLADQLNRLAEHLENTHSSARSQKKPAEGDKKIS